MRLAAEQGDNSAWPFPDTPAMSDDLAAKHIERHVFEVDAVMVPGGDRKAVDFKHRPFAGH